MLKKTRLWLIFVLAALVVYWPVLNNFFASDDFHWLVIARDTAWSWNIFMHNDIGTNFGESYNPLLVVIFKLAQNLFGLNYT